MIRDKIIAAGSGGQGALRIGQMIAYAALNEGWEVESLPSYGAEMRGGTSKCDLVISDQEIPFAMITEPDYLIVMNDLSLYKYQGSVKRGGTIIVNSSLIKDTVNRKDLTAYYIPADTIAEEENNPRGANMVMLGAYLAVADRVSLTSISQIIEESFTGSKAKYAEVNKLLVKKGFDYMKEISPGKKA